MPPTGCGARGGRYVRRQPHAEPVAVAQRRRGVVVDDRPRRAAVRHHVDAVVPRHESGRAPGDVLDPADEAALDVEPVADLVGPLHADRDAGQEIRQGALQGEADDAGDDAGGDQEAGQRFVHQQRGDAEPGHDIDQPGDDVLRQARHRMIAGQGRQLAPEEGIERAVHEPGAGQPQRHVLDRRQCPVEGVGRIELERADEERPQPADEQRHRHDVADQQQPRVRWPSQQPAQHGTQDDQGRPDHDRRHGPGHMAVRRRVLEPAQHGVRYQAREHCRSGPFSTPPSFHPPFPCGRQTIPKTGALATGPGVTVRALVLLPARTDGAS